MDEARMRFFFAELSRMLNSINERAGALEREAGRLQAAFNLLVEFSQQHSVKLVVLYHNEKVAANDGDLAKAAESVCQRTGAGFKEATLSIGAFRVLGADVYDKLLKIG